MGVDMKKIYAKVAESKQAINRGAFVKVSGNGAVLGINGNKEKVANYVKNLYAKQSDVIEFNKLADTELSKYHLIVIGSHDKKSPLSGRLKKYIEDGGSMVTTGRCLESIISELFPNTVVPEKQEIKAGAFKGEISNINHPFIRGVDTKKTLKFWVEEKSHPIKSVRPVTENIITSKKLEKKYGSGALFVAFKHGAGMVVHILPKLHSPKSNEGAHIVSAHVLSNILDESVIKAIPDEIKSPTETTQMAYVNVVVIDDPSKKCVFCGSTFADYKDKVYRCNSCNTHYHEFCIEQQLARDGTCTGCGRLLIFEKYKGHMEAAMAPPQFIPPEPPSEPEKKKEEIPPPPPK
ncbi:MAG: hypothetical protein JSW00_02595 [Thermoplasmata archaeon]|nr:MAG: hypothetical protein JSW00_02595 [Thermoplasmata archaeon]